MKNYEKTQKRNQLIVGIFLAFLMVASMFGIVNNRNQSVLKINKHKLYINDNQLIYKAKNKNIVFHYSPFKYNTSFYSELCNNIKTNNIKILFEPNATSISFIDYIRQEFYENSQKPIIFETTINSTEYPMYNTGNCDTGFTIYLKEGDFKQETDNNCYVLQGFGQDFLFYRDFLLYCELNII